MATVLNSKITEYQESQKKLNDLYAAKTNSLGQFNENTLVSGEFDLMNDESKVFKLVGPVLMAVDFAEAKQNVAKRLEFIETEIKKVDNQIAVCTESQNRLADEIMKMQTEMKEKAADEARQIADAASSDA